MRGPKRRSASGRILSGSSVAGTGGTGCGCLFSGRGWRRRNHPDILSSPDNMNGPATNMRCRCRAVSFCIRRERSGFCGLCVFHRKTLRFFSGRRSVCSPSQRLGDDLPFQIAGLIACAVDRLPLVALGRLVNDLGLRVVGFAAEFAAFKNRFRSADSRRCRPIRPRWSLRSAIPTGRWARKTLRP